MDVGDDVDGRVDGGAGASSADGPGGGGGGGAGAGAGGGGGGDPMAVRWTAVAAVRRQTVYLCWAWQYSALSR